jgi:general secretion pathway protein G
MKFKNKNSQGYTMIELMMVISIMALIASIVMPKFDLVLQRANQSKAKANLGSIRSALSLYYSQTDNWPMAGYPEGDTHYTSDSLSLTEILTPTFIATVPIPKVLDRMFTFNGLSSSFDSDATALMAMNPPKDAYILWGAADYTPMLSSPYVYDNKTGSIYIPNGNFDVDNQYFYTW